MKMTIYLIYRPEDCLVLQTGFATEKAAGLALKRKWGRYPTAQVASEKYFAEVIDHDIEVKGLEDGRMYTIRASDAGSCVDPSTERYWLE
jgi:hypothetical protein